MHGASSRRKFRQGSLVLNVRFPERGVGTVLRTGVETMLIYLGRNEWLTEHVPFADVRFDDGTEIVRLADIIDHRQVELYDTLRPGDFIVHGRRKKARVIVLSVRPRRGMSHVAKNCVLVLEDGAKRSLPIRSEIIAVNRAHDVTLR